MRRTAASIVVLLTILAPLVVRADELPPSAFIESVVGHRPLTAWKVHHDQRQYPRNLQPEECAMKMNSAQIQQTLHSLNSAQLNAEAIPPEHPMMSQLKLISSIVAASISSSPSKGTSMVGWASWST